MSKEKYQHECLDCNCYDIEGCTMPSIDQSYACTLEMKSILSELKSECSFKEVFDDLNEKTGEPKRKIGYIRADHNGYRWYNSVFPYHNDLCTAEIAHDIDYVYDRLIADNAFRTLTEMQRYCYAHKDCAVSKDTRMNATFTLKVIIVYSGFAVGNRKQFIIRFQENDLNSINKSLLRNRFSDIIIGTIYDLLIAQLAR